MGFQVLGVAESAVDRTLTFPADVIAVTRELADVGTGTVSLVSGKLHATLGCCVIPAGKTATGIRLIGGNSNAVGLTHLWAALMIPDDSGNQGLVVATTADDLNAGFSANSKKDLSLLTGDGGSGSFTPTVDTPVYVGAVFVGTSLSIRGAAGSGNVAVPAGFPYAYADGNTGLTTPELLPKVEALSGGNVNFYAAVIGA